MILLKLTAKQKKLIIWFAFAIFLAIFTSSGPIHSTLPLYDLHSFIYAGLVIAWGFLVHQRIGNKQVRTHLVIASVFMLILFLSRLVRWRCFRDVAFAQEYAWYAYYVSFAGVPLCAFLGALCVGKEEKDQPLQHARWLWLVWLAFTAVIFTNAWHKQMIDFKDEAFKERTLGPAYYVCVVWVAALTISTIVIILRRCQIATAKKYWYIPAIGVVVCAGLIGWYYALGSSSPKLFGIKLYNLQEIFCLLFIFPFESMIQLGIMPSNSRYDLFFENSPVSAGIFDETGSLVYASKTWAKEEKVASKARENTTLEDDVYSITEDLTQGGRQTTRDDESIRRSEKGIHGGKIVWLEDLTAIHKLDEEIQKVTEELEEENELIRQENEIRSERISYETKNRLYDKIAGAVREKALAIDAILSDLAEKYAKEAPGRTTEVREGLIRAMIMGAYVKRMGNLMLVTEESKKVSTKELGSAIRESLEYFGLKGITNDFQELGERLLPENLIVLSYELLETILEGAEELYSLLVFMDAREGYQLKILLDAPQISIGQDWHKEELAAEGARLTVEYVDDTWSVVLEAQDARAIERQTLISDEAAIRKEGVV